MPARPQGERRRIWLNSCKTRDVFTRLTAVRPDSTVLQTNCRRLQLKSIAPLVGDLRDLSWRRRNSQSGRTSDACGSIEFLSTPLQRFGVLRRHPEAKWRKSSERLRTSSRACNSRSLNRRLCCLRPGGVLVYSTCSTETEENEGVIDQFLRSHAEFRRESVAPWLPEGGRQLPDRRGDLSTMGNRDSMDASTRPV